MLYTTLYSKFSKCSVWTSYKKDRYSLQRSLTLEAVVESVFCWLRLIISRCLWSQSIARSRLFLLLSFSELVSVMPPGIPKNKVMQICSYSLRFLSLTKSPFYFGPINSCSLFPASVLNTTLCYNSFILFQISEISRIV